MYKKQKRDIKEEIRELVDDFVKNCGLQRKEALEMAANMPLWDLRFQKMCNDLFNMPTPNDRTRKT